jgi:predicted small metal-binding protein
MKQISCSDLGCCKDVVTGKDDADLKKNLFAHAQRLHPEMLKAMTPEMAKGLDSKIAQFSRAV